MPKTPMHEEHDPVPRKYKVRLTRQVFAVEAIAQAKAM